MYIYIYIYNIDSIVCVMYYRLFIFLIICHLEIKLSIIHNVNIKRLAIRCFKVYSNKTERRSKELCKDV